MCGAMRGAVTGAIVFEGLAKDIEEAEEVAASGGVVFSPCHEHDCVGSMAGVTSASMYMHIVKNAVHGNVAYTNLSEQLAKILRMGANDQSVIDRLVWMRDVFGPMLKQAVEITGEIDLRSMLAQALHMGDEDHNRNIAGTLLFFQSLASAMLQTDFTTEQKKEVFDFIASSDYFSGPTWMAVSKCAMDAAHGVPNSTAHVSPLDRRAGVQDGVLRHPGHHVDRLAEADQDGVGVDDAAHDLLVRDTDLLRHGGLSQCGEGGFHLGGVVARWRPVDLGSVRALRLEVLTE